MTVRDPVRQAEVKDKAEKVSNARQAAKAPDASERDRADLKLLEQDLIAEKKKEERAAASDSLVRPKLKPTDSVDKKLDAALKDSFPGSDAVSSLEPDPPKPDVRQKP
jgi:hypothetical protein